MASLLVAHDLNLGLGWLNYQQQIGLQQHIKTNHTTWNLSQEGFKGSWLKNKLLVNSGLKSHLKFLKTFCEEICFLSGFLSQVILLAYGLSFKMRYWGGLCDFRKNYWSCFCGYPHPNSIVNANVRTHISALSGQNESGKKF